MGFTAGIAVIILASQLKELFGLTLAGAGAGPIVPKLMALWAALPTVSPAAIGVALLALGIIVGLKRLRPAWPGMLVAVVAAVVSWLLSLPVETIASRFGGIPRTLPLPALPPLASSRRWPYCPMPWPSRSWARSRPCSRPWSPTG